jgi:hypothetical protein
MRLKGMPRRADLIPVSEVDEEGVSRVVIPVLLVA